MVLLEIRFLSVWFEALVVSEEAFSVYGQFQENLTQMTCSMAHGIPEILG